MKWAAESFAAHIFKEEMANVYGLVLKERCGTDGLEKLLTHLALWRAI